MTNFLLIVFFLAFIRSEYTTALNCYFCPDGCLTSQADQITCGKHIGKSVEPVCTTRRSKGTNNTNISERRCEIVTKQKSPQCDSTKICTHCRTDLCNGPPVKPTKDAASLLKNDLLIVSLIIEFVIISNF